MRSTTSLRRRSGSCSSTSEALVRSRWTRMVAMICGCSLRISSATASAPSTSGARCRWWSSSAAGCASADRRRGRRPAPWSAPRGCSRRNPGAARSSCSVSRRKSSSTSLTWSARDVAEVGHRRAQLLDLAAGRCCSTLAARVLAERHQEDGGSCGCRSSFMLGHPVLDQRRHHLRILVREFAGVLAGCRRGARRCAAPPPRSAPALGTSAAAGDRESRRLGAGPARGCQVPAQQRAQHGEARR